MLSIKDLKASIEDGTQILKGINLEVKPGEVHAIMGPNGSGKSTLSKVIAGHPAYKVDGGSVELDGKNLLEMEINERANSLEPVAPSSPRTSRAAYRLMPLAQATPSVAERVCTIWVNCSMGTLLYGTFSPRFSDGC